MGYEIRLLIGKSSTYKSGSLETWFNIYAHIDICKPGFDSEIYKLSQESHSNDSNHFWYWFASDGNTKVTEDRYGDKHKPIPVKLVYDAIKKDYKKDKWYRRFKWALGLLHVMKDDDEGLEVIFFGY